MNRSKSIALILGPCLVMAFLAAFWVKTHLPALDDAPLELHANVTGEHAPAESMQPRLAETDPSAPSATQPQEPQSPLTGQAGKRPETSGSAALPSKAPAAALESPKFESPKFDVVRVEPTGETVIAGHSEPNAEVAVVADGKIIVQGKTDAAGQFVLLPPPLTPGEHGLALRVMPPSGQPIVSDQNVAVSVPAKGKGEVMVALAEPGKPTVLMTDPLADHPDKSANKSANVPQSKALEEATPASESKPGGESKLGSETKPAGETKPGEAVKARLAAKPQVAIKTAEILEPGGFFASGIASPGAHLRLYLNGSVIADVKAGSDGHWSVKVIKGLVPGHYAVRADEIDGKANVVARAEVPFDYNSEAANKEAAAIPSVRPSAKEPEKQAANFGKPDRETRQAPSEPLDADEAKKSAKAEALNAAPRMEDAGPVAAPPARSRETAVAAPSVSTPSTAAPNVAVSPPSASQAASGDAGQSSSAVIAEIQTATVERGYSLWRISRDTLGHGNRYTEIYAANASQIRDPSLIYPGQVFVIPSQTD